VKCHQYYPLGEENEDDGEIVFEDVGLKVTYVTELEARYHYTARVYQLQDLRVTSLSTSIVASNGVG